MEQQLEVELRVHKETTQQLQAELTTHRLETNIMLTEQQMEIKIMLAEQDEKLEIVLEAHNRKIKALEARLGENFYKIIRRLSFYEKFF